MHESDLIAAYLRELRAALRVSPEAADRILAEVEDHLRQAVEQEAASGAPPLEAERRALARFGPPRKVARSFARPLPWARMFWWGLAIAVALPAVIPDVTGRRMALAALAVAVGLGIAPGFAAPRRAAQAGMLPGLAMAAFVLLRAAWQAWSAGDPRWLVQGLPTEVLLNLPLMTAIVLLGAFGGILGARLRAHAIQAA